MRVRLISGADPGRYAGALVVVAVVYYLVGRIGLELAYLDGAVAALWPPAGFGLAVLFLYGLRLWPAVVVGDLLLGDFSTPLGTVLAQTVGNTVAVVAARAAAAAPDQRARRSGAGRGRAVPRRLRAGRGARQRGVRPALAAARRRDPGRRARAGLPDVDAERRVRRAGRRAGDPHLGEPGAARHPPARGRGGRDRARAARGAGRAAAAARRALHRLSRAAVVGAALRAARRVGGDPRRVLDHGLEHGAQRRAVRARVDHRQPAGDAALHRDRGADLAGARRRHGRAHPRGGGAGAERGRPSARSPTSRPRCAGWPRSWPAERRRAACSSG